MNYLALSKKILSNHLTKASCFVGFDGFTDEIISVVDKTSNHNLSFIPTIKDFGKKIVEASHKSANFELITNKTKLGGNAPIFTNALLEGGHEIIFVGAIGKPNEIEPLFQPMSDRCKKVITLAPSGKTDALEFQDGKIILGKMESLKDITYENLLKQITQDDLIVLLDKTDLLATVNWTMVTSTSNIWKAILEKIAPHFSKREKKHYLFVDLADPSKRTKEDLLDAIDTLSKLTKYYDVTLGLNQKEAEILCDLYEIEFKKIEKSAGELFKKLKITTLLIHHATYALLVDADDFIYLESFHTTSPKIATGAGDNFNAGYCTALLYGLTKEETLITALATSGFYVRNGFSPSMLDLSNYLNNQDAK